MHGALRFCFGAVLVWQAIAGAIAIGGRIAAGADGGYGARLFASTDERLARVFGSDVELMRALRECATDGQWVLSRFPPLDTLTVAARQQRELLNKMRHALYPRPFMALSARIGMDPEPIATAEGQVPRGQRVLLIVLQGDPTPAGRAGWTWVRRAAAFELWQFQKA
ncbi:MAG TPA: hypothetical protein VK348_13470 [Planctomycetota bacterium]|nr:hypothetical protein [Planctomycetota bacterium]